MIEVTPAHFVIDIGQKAFLRVSRPPNVDIRLHDLLTFYTEVLTQENPNG